MAKFSISAYAQKDENSGDFLGYYVNPYAVYSKTTMQTPFEIWWEHETARLGKELGRNLTYGAELIKKEYRTPLVRVDLMSKSIAYHNLFRKHRLDRMANGYMTLVVLTHLDQTTDQMEMDLTPVVAKKTDVLVATLPRISEDGWVHDLRALQVFLEKDGVTHEDWLEDNLRWTPAEMFERTSDGVRLSSEGAEHFCMLAKSERGIQARNRYVAWRKEAQTGTAPALTIEAIRRVVIETVDARVATLPAPSNSAVVGDGDLIARYLLIVDDPNTPAYVKRDSLRAVDRLRKAA